MILTLTPAEIDTVKQNLATYQWAAQVVHIPWQMLAAIHYRETNLRIGKNPFQFDPVLTTAQIHDLLMHYSSLGEVEVTSLASAGIDNFKTACVCAAAWLVRKSLKRLDLQHCSDDVVKDALYGYNGRAYGPADNSPYVMNGFDKSHYPMHLNGTEPDPKDPTKRIHVSFEDHRMGAFVVYKQLLGIKF